ncbi:MAG: hypothetical protein ACTHNU_10930 [Gaiellales bacterium]
MSRRRTGYAIVASLILASAVAFARAEQLKLERSPVASPHITKHFSTTCTPGPRCLSHATLSFRLRTSSALGLSLVNSSGDTVWTFPEVTNRYPPGRVTVHWNGRLNGGERAPDGHYRLRIGLRSLGRTITIPNPVIVDTVRPKLTVTSPPGAAPVRYTVNEPAHVYLLLRPVGGGRPHLLRGRRGRVRIPAQLRRQPATMSLIAVDLAGNSSGVVSAGRLH